MRLLIKSVNALGGYLRAVKIIFPYLETIGEKISLRKVSNNLLFTAESNVRLIKAKQMITNLKELLIFNYFLLASGMSEIYTDVRVYMVHFSFLSLR